uniref:hypothetical protein n=1 Tax=Nocardiopsis halophila TaxID=141692 RepID=UPI00035EBB77
MRKWVRTSAKAALLTAGFVALGAGVSFADSAPVTSGNGSIGGGNQIVGNADVPVNVSGNAIALGGSTANATSKDTGAHVIDPSGDDGPVTSGNGSAVGGNQLVGDADVPVNVSGNAVGAIGGVAGAASKDTGAIVSEDGGAGNGGGDNGDNGGDNGDGYRTSQLAPATGGLVDKLSEASEPLHVQGHGVDAGPVMRQSHADVHDIVTSGNGSIGGGNQVVADADVPVNASGNAVAGVLSTAAAASDDTGAFVEDGRDREVITSGNGSVLGGNQLVGDADVPVNVSGNAVAGVLSTAAATSKDTGASVVESGRTGQSSPITSGNGSVLGGNQGVVDADVPVNVSGNAVAAGLSAANAASKDTGAFVEHHRS